MLTYLDVAYFVTMATLGAGVLAAFATCACLATDRDAHIPAGIAAAALAGCAVLAMYDRDYILAMLCLLIAWCMVAIVRM